MSGWLLARVRPWVFAGLVALPATALAEGGSVRYSYERAEVGDSVEWVLIPHLEPALVGKVDEKLLKNAFELLRKDKRGSYGKASVAISGKSPKLKAVVTIDPEYAKYSVIVVAESVYTLSELGVDEISFPGVTEGPVTRADVPFSGFSLTVPLYKAVGYSSDHVQVLMPNGDLVPSTQVATKWKAKDAALVAAMYDYLKSSDPYTVATVAKSLPGMKVPYADQVAGLLNHKSELVRATALEVLADVRDQKSVLEAVAAYFAKEKDAGLKKQAAEFLGASKDKSFNILLQIYRVDDADEKTAAAAVTALGDYSDARTTDVLVARLSDKRASVASAAAASLNKTGASDAMVKALAESKIDPKVKLELAELLTGQKADVARLAGNNYIATNDVEHKAVDAVGVIAKLGDAGRKTLEGYLSSDKAYLRAAAAEELVAAKSDASFPAFASAAKAGKDPAQMEEWIYAIMVGMPLKSIMDRTKDSNALVKRVAYRALGERAVKENAGSKVFGILKDGIGSSDASVRGASARAIGEFADAKSADALKPLVNDKSADVRRDVAVAIGNFKNGELADELKAMLDDKSPQVQAAAIRSFAQRSESFVWDRLKALVKSPDADVRAASMFALAKLVSRDDAQGVREVISSLSGAVNDDAAIVRLTSIEALGTFRDEKAVTGIAIQLNTDDEALRVAAVKALGTTTHPSAETLVESVAGDPNRKIRKAAIEAFGSLKAKRALEERLKVEKDKELQDLIRATIKRI
ncbi:MAG: HEAT repeat domain-containing protein [bacterium]